MKNPIVLPLVDVEEKHNLLSHGAGYARLLGARLLLYAAPGQKEGHVIGTEPEDLLFLNMKNKQARAGASTEQLRQLCLEVRKSWKPTFYAECGTNNGNPESWNVEEGIRHIARIAPSLIIVENHCFGYGTESQDCTFQTKLAWAIACPVLCVSTASAFKTPCKMHYMLDLKKPVLQILHELHFLKKLLKPSNGHIWIMNFIRWKSEGQSRKMAMLRKQVRLHLQYDDLFFVDIPISIKEEVLRSLVNHDDFRLFVFPRKPNQDFRQILDDELIRQLILHSNKSSLFF